MTKPYGNNRIPDLNPTQRRILRQVYEILQLDETAWQPLRDFVEDYHHNVLEAVENNAEPAAGKELTRFPKRTLAKREELQFHEPESLRSLIKKVIFAVSLFLENQREDHERNQPVLAENDLESPCGSCQGSGYVQHPQWKTWWDTYLRAGDRNLPFPNVKEEMLCPQCGGKGTVLTTQGEILVKGLKKYMK